MIKQILSLVLFLFVATNAVAQSRYAIIETSEGNIKIELYAKQSPKTVAAFRTHFINRGEMRLSYNVGWQGGRGSQ